MEGWIWWLYGQYKQITHLCDVRFSVFLATDTRPCVLISPIVWYNHNIENLATSTACGIATTPASITLTGPSVTTS